MVTYLIIAIAGVFMVLFLIFQTWKSYLAIMSFRHNRAAIENATPLAQNMAYLMLVEGLILDVLMNLLVGTIAFYEFPQEWLLTNRCSRHLSGNNALRKHRAEWFCRNWLDPYDIGGNHCR